MRRRSASAAAAVDAKRPNNSVNARVDGIMNRPKSNRSKVLTRLRRVRILTFGRCDRNDTNRPGADKTMSARILLTWCAAGWLAIVATASGRFGTAAAAAPAGTLLQAADTSASSRALLDKYCVSCHNERLKTGGLALDTVNVADIASHAEMWEKVVRKLRAGTMPPVGRPRPDKTAVRALVSS